jgi:hypothetical protein
MSVIPGGFFPLNQTVTLYSNVDTDEWGIPVKTPNPKNYRVRLEFNSAARLIQTGEDGKEIVFVATIFFKGAVPVDYTDYIEYDSGVNGIVKVLPRNISPMLDMSGRIVYTKVII